MCSVCAMCFPARPSQLCMRMRFWATGAALLGMCALFCSGMWGVRGSLAPPIIFSLSPILAHGLMLTCAVTGHIFQSNPPDRPCVGGCLNPWITTASSKWEIGINMGPMLICRGRSYCFDANKGLARQGKGRGKAWPTFGEQRYCIQTHASTSKR